MIPTISAFIPYSRLLSSTPCQVKSRGNIICYNTVMNNPGGTFAFRNGDDNVAYGNFILGGSGGFKVKQANNIWFATLSVFINVL